MSTRRQSEQILWTYDVCYARLSLNFLHMRMQQHLPIHTYVYMYLCLTGYPVLSCIATFRLTVQCYFPLALSIWLYILQIVIRALLRVPLVVVVVFHVDTSVVIAPTLQTL